MKLGLSETTTHVKSNPVLNLQTLILYASCCKILQPQLVVHCSQRLVRNAQPWRVVRTTDYEQGTTDYYCSCRSQHVALAHSTRNVPTTNYGLRASTSYHSELRTTHSLQFVAAASCLYALRAGSYGSNISPQFTCKIRANRQVQEFLL